MESRWLLGLRGMGIQGARCGRGCVQPAAGYSPARKPNAHGPRYGAAALVYLIVVILDIAPVQDVIPSHYVPDDEDCTR
jgi:hypothetical protein